MDRAIPQSSVPLVLRLLLVAAVALGHCCLMVHGAGAMEPDPHGALFSAVPGGLPGDAVSLDASDACAVCDGASVMASSRTVQQPPPALTSVPLVPVPGVRGVAPPVLPYHLPPVPHRHSLASLQVFLI